ncbi:uncharacterized protein LOC109921541 isoform X1 [Rhincodon typus]|uniref:uncharacterized protein LOC109921541 isoform X1 n=1 Tax=Rhincodon typus TaxID=259920 RepID=UPI00202FEA8B|nr:uncharacterized protein LOC109921541 isoform X1 [Rhincodon typus]
MWNFLWKMLSFPVFFGIVHLRGLVRQEDVYKPSPPTIHKSPAPQSNSDGQTIAITCKGNIHSNESTYYLYNSRHQNYTQLLHLTGDEKTATFVIKMGTDSIGNYSCNYKTKVLGNWVYSPFSKHISITQEDEWQRKAEQDAQKKLCLYVDLTCGALLIVLIIVTLTSFFIVNKATQGKRHNIERKSITADGITKLEEHDATYINVAFQAE